MISDNNFEVINTVVGCILVCTFLIASLVFTITNNLKQIVSHYLILKLSITASLYGSRVYLGICIYDYSNNIPFSHIAILL